MNVIAKGADRIMTKTRKKNHKNHTLTVSITYMVDILIHRTICEALSDSQV